MSFFLVFAITLLDAIALSYLTRRPFGRTAADVNLSTIVVLYVAGLFLRLDIGMYVWLGLSAALVCACVVCVLCRRDGRALFDVVKNPLFMIYTVMGIAFGVFLLEALSHDYDEMTHWALVTKNMVYYNNFGNIGDTTTMFNRYVPATGVWMYAFQFFNPTFVNGNCYAAFDVLLLSLVLPLPQHFGPRQPAKFLISLLGSMGLLALLKCNIYFNLRIDGILGLMGAYIYLLYLCDRGHVDGHTLAEMGLGCFVVTLTKTSGLPLACIAVGLSVMDVLLRGRQYIRPFFRRKLVWLCLLLPILAIVGAKVSWNLYCNVYHVRAGWNVSELTATSFWAYLTHPNQFQRQVTTLFWRNYFVGRIRYGGGSLQVPFYILFPLTTGLSIWMYRRTSRAFGIGAYVATLSVFLIYAVINLILYVFSFSYAESLQLASFPRYYGTIVTMMGLIWLGWVADSGLAPLPQRDYTLLWRRLGLTFALLVTALIPIAFCAFRYDRDAALAPHRAWLRAISHLSDEDRVYYVAADDVEDNYLVRFLATPTRCSGWQVGGAYPEGRGGWTYSGDAFSWKLTPDEFAARLDGYDYFYLDSHLASFSRRYGALFVGDELQTCRLYRMQKEGDVILLSLIEEAPVPAD